MTHLIYSVLPRPRRPIVFIESQVSVASCIELMITEDIGALVVREQTQLLGIISERDIVRAYQPSHLDPNKTTAADIAFRAVTILNINDPVEKAMEAITLTKRRYVLVEENEVVVAILSIGDLLFHLLDDKSRVIEHLEHYITS